ncbi:MAG: hypothetical protein IKN75_07715 [Prevotella sp.]|nr:hypothetical protein [Prevotella sp.]
MKFKQLLTKSLLAAVCLLAGQNVWANDVYTIVYGTPTYTDEVITGVTPQTDFTTDDGSITSDATFSDGNGNTASFPIEGSALITSPNFTHGFVTPVTKGTVHFEANYSTPTSNTQSDNAQAWKIIDSKGVVIFGSNDAGQSKSNGNYNFGFCNGVSLGTAWFRLPRSTGNRVVLDINFSTRKVSYSILVSNSNSGNNRVTTQVGTYDLPEGVVDVAGLSGSCAGGYTSLMDNVSFYNVYDDAVTEYSYTVNYKLGDDVVKISSGSAAVDAVITAETAINGSEEGFVGNHYLITAAEAPTMTITSGTNVLNVPVRAPYTATLNVTKTIGGVAQTPVVTNLVETDAKVCSWNYTYPMYVQKDGVYYVADVTSSFGESGTFTNGETINKTVAYTNPDYSVVYFGEPNEVTGTNTAYSNGATGYITGGVSFGDDRVIRLGQLQAGTYRLITNVIDRPDRNVVVGDYTSGTESFPTALVTISTAGAQDESFTVDGTQLISISGKDQGNSKFNQSATVDYILVKAATVSKTISAAGWATYCSPYALDLSNATGLTDAYIVTGGSNGVLTKSSVKGGTVPANTGLLLKGNEGTATIPVVANSSTDVSANKLIGVTAETPIAAETGYVLLKENDVLGFYKNNKAFTLGANTAYLPTSFDQNAPAHASYLLFDDMTGISNVAGSKVKTNSVIYNLNGQRVSNPTKGIYIIDGVKVAIE